MSLLLEPKKPEREFTPLQTAFLNHLFGEEAKGNPRIAFKLAGYSGENYHNVLNSLKDEIIERAKTILAAHAPEAAFALINTLSDGATAPGANIRLGAAQQVLDRIGIVKQDKLDINIDAPSGIFILPAKKNDTV